MQGGTAIVAEETNRGQMIIKKKAKKDHKDKMRRERWKPPKQEVRPNSIRLEEYEEKLGPDIAALLLTGKYTNGDTTAKILRYNSRKKRG